MFKKRQTSYLKSYSNSVTTEVGVVNLHSEHCIQSIQANVSYIDM